MPRSRLSRNNPPDKKTRDMVDAPTKPLPAPTAPKPMPPKDLPLQESTPKRPSKRDQRRRAPVCQTSPVTPVPRSALHSPTSHVMISPVDPAPSTPSPLPRAADAESYPPMAGTPLRQWEEMLLSQTDTRAEIGWDTSSPDAYNKAKRVASKDNSKKMIGLLSQGIKKEPSTDGPSTPAFLRYSRGHPASDAGEVQDGAEDQQRPQRPVRRVREWKKSRALAEESRAEMFKVSELLQKQFQDFEELEELKEKEALRPVASESDDLTYSAAIAQLRNSSVDTDEPNRSLDELLDAIIMAPRGENTQKNSNPPRNKSSFSGQKTNTDCKNSKTDKNHNNVLDSDKNTLKTDLKTSSNVSRNVTTPKSVPAMDSSWEDDDMFTDHDFLLKASQLTDELFDPNTKKFRTPKALKNTVENGAKSITEKNSKPCAPSSILNSVKPIVSSSTNTNVITRQNSSASNCRTNSNTQRNSVVHSFPNTRPKDFTNSNNARNSNTNSATNSSTIMSTNVPAMSRTRTNSGNSSVGPSQSSGSGVTRSFAKSSVPVSAPIMVSQNSAPKPGNLATGKAVNSGIVKPFPVNPANSTLVKPVPLKSSASATSVKSSVKPVTHKFPSAESKNSSAKNNMPIAKTELSKSNTSTKSSSTTIKSSQSSKSVNVKSAQNKTNSSATSCGESSLGGDMSLTDDLLLQLAEPDLAWESQASGGKSETSNPDNNDELWDDDFDFGLPEVKAKAKEPTPSPIPPTVVLDPSPPNQSLKTSKQERFLYKPQYSMETAPCSSGKGNDAKDHNSKGDKASASVTTTKSAAAAVSLDDDFDDDSLCQPDVLAKLEEFELQATQSMAASQSVPASQVCTTNEIERKKADALKKRRLAQAKPVSDAKKGKYSFK